MLSDMCCLPCLRLDLRLATIGEELGAGNETGIIGREEQRRAGDLVRISNPPERQFRCHLIEQALLRRPVVSGEAEQTWRVCRSGAQHIDPYPSLPKVERPVT